MVLQLLPSPLASEGDLQMCLVPLNEREVSGLQADFQNKLKSLINLLTFPSDRNSTILQATIINEKNVHVINIILVFQSDGQLGMSEMNYSPGFYNFEDQIF